MLVLRVSRGDPPSARSLRRPLDEVRRDAEEARLTQAIVTAPGVPDTMDTVRNWPVWSAASNPKGFALDLSPLPAADRRLRADRGSFRLSGQSRQLRSAGSYRRAGTGA